MKHPKPQSLTTDTRLSQSNFFNSSLLQKTNMTTTSQKANNLTLSNTFNNNNHNKLDNKEVDFLNIKNLQLQQRVKRMTQQIKKLQDNKINLLKLNQKYVKVVNQYYNNTNYKANNNLINTKQHNPNQNPLSKNNPNLNPLSKDNQNKNKDNGLFNKSNHNQTRTSSKFFRSYEQNQAKIQRQCSKYKSTFCQQPSAAEQVLTGLEKDYRNLVKHCLVMQNQIKNYAQQMQKFTQMKQQLYSVNHTTPKQLIIELQQTTFQNKQLKKQNNRLSYELQKFKIQNNKLKKTRDNQNKQLNSNNDDSQKIKAQIIKITQQTNDKANLDKQTIYQLELKVEKLQKQLRSGQQYVIKNQQKRKQLEIQRVQNVHENSFLRANLSQLLDPKKHPLLSLDRSFLYKKKKQPTKRISLNLSIRD